MEGEHKIMLDEINPSWMFDARPRDYTGFQHTWICPGVFYLAGQMYLFLLHWACFTTFLNTLCTNGYRSNQLLYLLPVMVLWLLGVSADIKFRLQRPTRAERDGFDNAFVNWFGFLSTVTLFYLILPVGIVSGVVALIWRLVA